LTISADADSDQGGKKDADKKKEDVDKAPSKITVDVTGLESRIQEVPLPSGNYSDLTVGEKHLFFTDFSSIDDNDANLMAAGIARKDVEAKQLFESIRSYELSADGKKLLVRKDDDLYVIDASDNPPAKLADAKVDLKGWTFLLDPREEWRQMFDEAWRLERDYFYDTGMHGVDWEAIREKHRPLVERVTDRRELSDLLGQMISNLSALHMSVSGGDMRDPDQNAAVASLGARLERDAAASGYRVVRIYRADPGRPDLQAPLARPGVDINEGDIIAAINGVGLAGNVNPAALMLNQSGKEVVLDILPQGKGPARKVVVEPIPQGADHNLRYNDWKLSRRLMTDSLGGGDIGYVHLSALGADNYAEWARDYFPVWNRKGLIVDVRHNQGGNIDSWILGSLMRRPWMYWQPRVGNPDPNFQYGFNGYIAVLCDEWTASDGEMFLEGMRRLKLGRIIGTRTWGGGIWLSYANRLVDNGIASAAEFGVFGPEGSWPIEWHGVSPDTTVDNLPHETFLGKDAQLEAAVAYLKDRLRREPIPEPILPEYPDRTRLNRR